MRTIVQRLRHEPAPTKGSRFIVTAAPAGSEEVAQALLQDVAQEMPDASHHCWAWRIASPSIDRAGDDGEPAGSAGRPILSQLTGRDLVDTAVIVTRYFGGTKLGVGGLVRAYGGAAGETLDAAETAEWQRLMTVELVHSHADSDAVARAIASVGGTTAAIIYGADVSRTITIGEPALDELASIVADVTAGRAVFGESQP